MGSRRARSWRGAAAAALLFSAVAAQAVVLPPGASAALPGTTVAAQPQLAGIVEVDDIVPFSFGAYGGTVSGSVQVRVVRSTLDGTLDFYWRVFNDAASSGAIGSFRIGDFVASSYDADWRIDGLGAVAPLTANRFGGSLDSYVNFNFGDLLAPGTSSMFFFLDTDALTYARNAIYDLANIGHTEISGLFAMYGPAPATVPEPGSLSLLLAAGVVGGWLARRRPTASRGSPA